MNYSVYGYSVFSPCTGVLAFNGQVHDRWSNCYLLGNGVRAFSPALMRFISPDPYSPFGEGGLHTYAYCAGDPVNYMDIDGNVKLRVLTRNDRRSLSPEPPPASTARQSLIVTAAPKRASVIVFAGSLPVSEVMGTPGQTHEGSQVFAPASPSTSRSPRPTHVTPVAQSGQILSNSQAGWNNPGFEGRMWEEGVSRYLAYKTAHGRTTGKDSPLHLVAALVINKNKGMVGNPFKSYPAYAKAHMFARSAKKIPPAASRLAAFVMAVRKFEERSEVNN